MRACLRAYSFVCARTHNRCFTHLAFVIHSLPPPLAAAPRPLPPLPCRPSPPVPSPLPPPQPPSLFLSRQASNPTAPLSLAKRSISIHWIDTHAQRTRARARARAHTNTQARRLTSSALRKSAPQATRFARCLILPSSCDERDGSTRTHARTHTHTYAHTDDGSICQIGGF